MINKLGNNRNPRSKSLSFIRNIINKASQEGIITENVFKQSKFEIKRVCILRCIQLIPNV
ncbi:MAG: hypothetical protein JEZ14_24995 [Marinilabiliaceae bacterium]|nr:hypothetical protein [Marinilabiliaceae bacterium]